MCTLAFVKRTDLLVCQMADRHYSRQTRGYKQVGSNCRLAVLRNPEGTIALVYGYPYDDMRADKQNGINCELFRNESGHRSSELLLQAEQLLRTKWPQATRHFTYVDPTAIRSPNPGYCFKIAGYKYITTSQTGKILLAKEIT